MSISDIVDLVHPTPSGIGVITSDQVWVLFDREIDEATFSQNFFLTGPDNDTHSGPDLQIYHEAPSIGEESGILESPGYAGIVQGEYTFERVNLTTLVTGEYLDTIGSGILYRTKGIFTPNQRLQANTEYTVYLSGDDDTADALKTGISTRTIYDPVETITGTGSAEFSGTYDGFATTDTFVVTITTAGTVDQAKFTYYKTSDIATVYGPFKTKRSGTLLSDGVICSFAEGSYIAGDSWSVFVQEKEIYSGNYVWTFKTGSGSILEIPSTISTTLIGESATSTDVSFTIESTDPEDEESNIAIPTADYDVAITFSSTIDTSTVTSGSYSVYTESTIGDPAVTASGLLTNVAYSISDNVLTLTIPSGLLFDNNLVTVTLDKDIAGTNGTSLETDQSFWFTMNYSPLYCSERRLRVMIGAFIQDIATDTINQAIHLASIEANARTWNKSSQIEDYYQFARSQWTCCSAASMLLVNSIGANSGLQSKKLGDLEVRYGNTSLNNSIPLKKAEDCMEKWEGVLAAGGKQVQGAKMVVKGELDVDRPEVGRLWLNSSTLPVANTKVLPSNSRRRKGHYFKGWWSK